MFKEFLNLPSFKLAYDFEKKNNFLPWPNYIIRYNRKTDNHGNLVLKAHCKHEYFMCTFP
jgi:hypothetical protein